MQALCKLAIKTAAAMFYFQNYLPETNFISSMQGIANAHWFSIGV